MGMARSLPLSSAAVTEQGGSRVTPWPLLTKASSTLIKLLVSAGLR